MSGDTPIAIEFDLVLPVRFFWQIADAQRVHGLDEAGLGCRPQPNDKWYEKNFNMKFGKKKDTRHDRPEDSFLRALEIIAKLESPYYEPGPPPDFPLEMKSQEALFWNVCFTNIWLKGQTTLRKGLIPVLNGDAERISKVQQTIETKREKRQVVNGR